MGQKFIVTRFCDRIVSGIYDGKEFLELNVMEEEESRLNNIYTGRVENVVKNINCAFIEIEKGVNCYYSLEEKGSPIFLNKKNSDKACQGDLMLVQVVKEAVKSKPPTVTCDITIPGKYAVLARDASSVFISNKIKDKNRSKELKAIFKPLLQYEEETFHEPYGFVVRTNAEEANNNDIVKEAVRLREEYIKIMKAAPYRTAFTKLYSGEKAYIEDIDNIKAERLERIITDSPDIYEDIKKHFEDISAEESDKLTLYEDKLLPLHKLYSIETAIKNALSKKVWLKSGGYLIIEPTEALTVIDVNTGKFSLGKKEKEESFLKINMEAAFEIAKQLRVRNISGIIIVDFINMIEKENNRILLNELGKLFQKDNVPVQVIGMTKLGLVEITRKKCKKPLHEMCSNWQKGN